MPDDASVIFAEVLSHLRENSPDLCRHWFDELGPVSLDAGVLSIQVDDEVHIGYLERHTIEAFRDAARAVTGRLISIDFRPSLETAQRSTVASLSNRRSEPEEGGLALNPDYTFAHFVVGPGNRLAHAAAKAVAEQPGIAYNPFFVHGDVGLGKTHLLQAVCLRIRQDYPSVRLFYTSCEGFMSRFIEDVQAGRMAEFRHLFRDVDVLAIDDVHFLAKRDRTQEEFFHTFNALYQDQKQIILSSDAPPEQIPDLEDRLVSRFKWGLVASVDAPGFETRVEIIKEKGRLRGLPVPDDVACYVAEHVSTNIRELEGALTKIQLQSAIEKRPVDVQIAMLALGDAAEAPKPTLDSIIRLVTEHYGVRVSELQSKKRSRSIALPRQVCMFLARQHTGHSLGEIGGFFGGRDHTTVMHAIRTIEAKQDTDEILKESVSSIERSLRMPAGRNSESMRGRDEHIRRS